MHTMPTMREIADALASLRPTEIDAAAILTMLEQRQKLIDTLAVARPPADERERAEIRAILNAVFERDAQLVEAAEAALEGVGEELARVRDGRTAVRGYRNAAPHGAGAVLQSA